MSPEDGRKRLEAAWQAFENGLDDMVREEEAALRRIASDAIRWYLVTHGGLRTKDPGEAAANKEIQEETEAAQARAGEILASARALVDAEREHIESIACAVADAWVPIARSGLGIDRTLAEALDRLELATRTSALRKEKL